MLRFVLISAALFGRVAGSKDSCVFCAVDKTSGSSYSFDFSSLPSETFSVNGTAGPYYVTSPCSIAERITSFCSPPPRGPALQGCRTLGSLAWNASAALSDPAAGSKGGVLLTLMGGSADPPCGKLYGGNRTLMFNMICDPDAPASNPPESLVEGPSCFYTVNWRHPSACGSGGAKPADSCTDPTPPAPPTPKCVTCHPAWNPTWDMRNSTLLYTCNNTGMHSVQEALRYGVAVYDWSNGKQIWANQHPMNDEELLTKQAEMVLAADPGVPGGQPRVWVYRNTIKALNWYTSVREKLDDPAYAGWFVRFKDYKGPESNNSYHVPACTYEKCSGFYHDQEQTPEYPRGDGSCTEECDCGKAPCGEYIFDHRNASFSDWFVNEYMISSETLLHKPQLVGLGWLDDSMQLTGPTEEDKNFTVDTGSTPEEMQAHVWAYQANMKRLYEKAVPMGSWAMQLFRGEGPQVRNSSSKKGPRNVTADECKKTLRSQFCTPKPSAWDVTHLYHVDPSDAIEQAVQYTSEFLLTRGEYAYLGYSWVGCSSQERPRPVEWDRDYGVPKAPCAETGTDTGIFEREFDKATVTWDCNTGIGSIQMKA